MKVVRLMVMTGTACLILGVSVAFPGAGTDPDCSKTSGVDRCRNDLAANPCLSTGCGGAFTYCPNTDPPDSIEADGIAFVQNPVSWSRCIIRAGWAQGCQENLQVCGDFLLYEDATCLTACASTLSQKKWCKARDFDNPCPVP